MCRSAELWNTGTDKLGSTSSLWYWLTGWAWINYVSLSYPTSEVRGRSWKDPMPEGQRPRGVTPCRRSGAAAKSARLRRRRNGREELPKCEVRGGGWEEIPRERGQGRRLRGDTLRKRSEVAVRRSYRTPPSLRPGAAAGGATLCWRPGAAARRTNPTSKEPGLHKRAGGPRGAIPRWRSGRAAVRRYPSSKVRSSSCALLEQPWRDTPRPG